MTESKEMHYWVGHVWATTILQHPKVEKSVRGYMSQRLRVLFERVLSKWVCDESEAGNDLVTKVNIFGGMVKRRIRSSNSIQKELKGISKQISTWQEAYLESPSLDITPPVQLPKECFVDSDSDIDIFFPTKLLVDTFLDVLRKNFRINTNERKEAVEYVGFVVTKVNLGLKHVIFGPDIEIQLDFVTPAPHDSKQAVCCLLPDFNVNQIALTLTIPRTISLFSGDYWTSQAGIFKTAEELAKIFQHIQDKTAKILVFSHFYFLHQLKRHAMAIKIPAGNVHFDFTCFWFTSTIFTRQCFCFTDLLVKPEPDERAADADESEPDEQAADADVDEKAVDAHINKVYGLYLQRLFGGRLLKMIRNGWKITNLAVRFRYQPQTDALLVHFRCGHVATSTGLLYNRYFDSVGMTCSECGQVTVVFTDFLVK
jgi:hypothetical protein